MNARQDPKLQEVLMECGLAGIGAYWCIVEQLYEQGGTLPRRAYKTIAFTLHCEAELVRQVVEEFNLFDGDSDHFWSNAVNKRLNDRKEVTEKRREAISKRWADSTDQGESTAKNTNVIQEKNKSNSNVIQSDTIKENKIKEKEIKENNNSLSVSLSLDESEGASVTLAEKMRFLEIFYFEKNFKEAVKECDRFIAHYEANEWKRKGSKETVKSREALARLWKPETEGARHNPTAVQWLSEVYAKAKSADISQALRIIAEVYGMSYEVQDSLIKVQMYTSAAAKTIIEKYYVHRRGWQVQFLIKQ